MAAIAWLKMAGTVKTWVIPYPSRVLAKKWPVLIIDMTSSRTSGVE